MSDRHPTTQRGRIRIVGFDDAVADQQAGDRENDDDDDTIATGPIDSSTTPGRPRRRQSQNPIGRDVASRTRGVGSDGTERRWPGWE